MNYRLAGLGVLIVWQNPVHSFHKHEDMRARCREQARRMVSNLQYHDKGRAIQLGLSTARLRYTLQWLCGVKGYAWWRSKTSSAIDVSACLPFKNSNIRGLRSHSAQSHHNWSGHTSAVQPREMWISRMDPQASYPNESMALKCEGPCSRSPSWVAGQLQSPHWALRRIKPDGRVCSSTEWALVRIVGCGGVDCWVQRQAEQKRNPWSSDQRLRWNNGGGQRWRMTKNAVYAMNWDQHRETAWRVGPTRARLNRLPVNSSSLAKLCDHARPGKH